MTRPPSKFPRRYAQRQALHHGRGGTPPLDSPNQKRPQAYEPRVKKTQRSASYSDVDDSSSDSGSNSDSNAKRDHDSSYGSGSDSDAKAEYYRQKMAEFKEAGPTISNPGDRAKVMMKTEEQNWKR
jgi:hypothetical protein